MTKSDSLVAPVKKVSKCRWCHRDLEVRVEAPRVDARVKISLVCPKHGALGKGERYLMGYST